MPRYGLDKWLAFLIAALNRCLCGMDTILLLPVLPSVIAVQIMLLHGHCASGLYTDSMRTKQVHSQAVCAPSEITPVIADGSSEFPYNLHKARAEERCSSHTRCSVVFCIDSITHINHSKKHTQALLWLAYSLQGGSSRKDGG